MESSLSQEQLRGTRLWLNLAIGAAAFAATLTFPILPFPDGRFQTWPKRTVAFFSGIAIVLLVGGLITGGGIPPGSSSLYERTRNPLALSDPFLDPGLGVMLTILCGVLSIRILLAGFRRSRGARRQQYKWIVVTMVSVVVIAFTRRLPYPRDGNGSMLYVVTTPILSLSYALVPVAMGIAILRYRL